MRPPIRGGDKPLGRERYAATIVRDRGSRRDKRAHTVHSRRGAITRPCPAASGRRRTACSWRRYERQESRHQAGAKTSAATPSRGDAATATTAATLSSARLWLPRGTAGPGLGLPILASAVLGRLRVRAILLQAVLPPVPLLSVLLKKPGRRHPIWISALASLRRSDSRVISPQAGKTLDPGSARSRTPSGMTAAQLGARARQLHSRTSTKCPAMAAAAAMTGETKCVRPL